MCFQMETAPLHHLTSHIISQIKAESCLHILRMAALVTHWYLNHNNDAFFFAHNKTVQVFICICKYLIHMKLHN